MKLIDNVLNSPTKSVAVFGGTAAVSHYLLALDLMVTGGICAVGAFFVWKARNKKG